LVYFDDTALPLWLVSDAGLKIAAHYYNSNMQRHDRAPAKTSATRSKLTCSTRWCWQAGRRRALLSKLGISERLLETPITGVEQLGVGPVKWTQRDDGLTITPDVTGVACDETIVFRLATKAN
jgi:hypothetical protein